LGIPATFEERDFLDALTGRTDLADVIWIGLSLHHLRHDDKLGYMRSVRAALNPDGLFLVFENTSRDGETRDDWLDRWDTQEAAWTAYTPAEWSAMRNHVRSADFPETASAWQELGHAAGFPRVREIYRNPPDLFRVFCFSSR
jgi:SAM-dependent methyltransferase